jgi:UPF0176 protein
MPFTVIALYKFVALSDCEALCSDWLLVGQQHGVKGTLMLAPEGINGTVAGTAEAIAALLAHIRRDGRFADVDVKYSEAAHLPFQRLKVKVKREIVTLGDTSVDPTQQVGRYVAPQDWNALIQDPEVLVVDTRNHYEVAIGSFVGAHNPQTHRFRDFPAYVAAHLDPQRHKKVAMFCTGGIRCEKASSLLRSQGFEQVYHLQGGILNYLAQVPAAESLWQGECFVFDERVAVGQDLAAGSYGLCEGCGHPIPTTGKDAAVHSSSPLPPAPCPQCGHPGSG